MNLSYLGMTTVFTAFLVLGLGFFAFWALMLVDCLKKDFDDKLVWVLVMIFVPVIGAFLYFFIVKKQKKTGIFK